VLLSASQVASVPEFSAITRRGTSTLPFSISFIPSSHGSLGAFIQLGEKPCQLFRHAENGQSWPEELKNNKDLRNELICYLKDNSNLSIREIAAILGINRNIVQRV